MTRRSPLICALACLMAVSCSQHLDNDPELWSTCSCGALQIQTIGGNVSGVNLLHRRHVEKETILLQESGLVDDRFAFVFDNPSSGMVLDRSEIRLRTDTIFHPAQLPGNSALDFGLIMERAAEIHVIDSCFAFLTTALQLKGSTRKVIHRYASGHLVETAESSASCPAIEDSLLSFVSSGWEVLSTPWGTEHLEPQIVHPPHGEVVMAGSEIEDDPAERVIVFSTRKVRVLPPDVTLFLRHNVDPRGFSGVSAEPLRAVAFQVALEPCAVDASEKPPRCPTLNGVPLADLGATCEASIRFDDQMELNLGRTFSEMTLRVGDRIASRVVSWFNMTAEDARQDAVFDDSSRIGVDSATEQSSAPGGHAEAGAAACADVDVFWTEEYMPSPECLEAGGRSPSEEALLPCSEAMEALLVERQLNPRGCSQVRAAGFSNYGLGSTLHYLLVQLHRAALRGDSIAVLGEWVYGGCEAKNFSCAFEPWSPCTFPPGHPIDPDYPRFAPESQAPDEAFEECAAGHANRLFHYASVLASFLWRPNRAMAQAAAGVRAAIGLPERYLGMHVRHGDFCVASKVVEEESKECFSVLSYAEAIGRMAERYGVHAVFLASDNQESLELLRELCPQLTFYWQPDVDREFLEATVEDFEREQLWVESKLFSAAQGRRLEHLTEIMVDVILLLGSVGFVGQFSSNISRLVVEVNSRRNKRIMPFISLDLAFCYSGGRGFRFLMEDGTWERPAGKDESQALFYC